MTSGWYCIAITQQEDRILKTDHRYTPTEHAALMKAVDDIPVSPSPWRYVRNDHTREDSNMNSSNAINQNFIPYPYTFPSITFTVALTEADAGCWFDGARGWADIGQEVQEVAVGLGWAGELLDASHEWVGEAIDEAEAYLNDHHAPTGFYFGPSEAGDWGLWAIEND
jgi:hypothetical protein